MNTLNPNILEFIQTQTGFQRDRIKKTFEFMKNIEHLSHKEFVLTEEKLVKFVKRCRERNWYPDDVASKLAARVAINYAQPPMDSPSVEDILESLRKAGFA